MINNGFHQLIDIDPSLWLRWSIWKFSGRTLEENQTKAPDVTFITVIASDDSLWLSAWKNTNAYKFYIDNYKHMLEKGLYMKK